MKTTGIVLIIIGLIMTIFTSFKYFTREKVVDIGAIEITADKPNYLSWSPILGVIIIVVGGVMMWQAKKN